MLGLEWFLLVLLVYAVGSVVRHPRRRRRGPDGGSSARLRIGFDGGRGRRRLAELTAGRLPVEHQLKVEAIHRKAESMLRDHGHRFPLGSRERYLVERTLTDYLPATLEAYFRLPPGYANWPIRADGRTGLQVLWEQLDLLDTRLDEMARELERSGVDELLANGRFLEERFGASRR